MITKAIISAVLSLTVMSAAQASGTVVSAVGATILSGGPGIGLIEDTFNGFGLIDATDLAAIRDDINVDSAPYVGVNGVSIYTSGVTNWDTYFAAKPYHDFNYYDPLVYDGSQEWFSNDGATSASVSYDLGSVQSIQGLALWVEDGVGIRRLSLLGSTDGTTWFSLLSNLSPTNNANDKPYLADQYTWTAKSLRYVKLDMSGCPQTGAPTNSVLSCGIGEVAFNAAPPTTAVPELGTLGMTAFGLGMMALVLRRRRA